MRLSSSEKTLLANLYALNKFESEAIVEQLTQRGYDSLTARQMASFAKGCYEKRSRMTSTKGFESGLRFFAVLSGVISLFAYVLYKGGYFFTGDVEIMKVALWVVGVAGLGLLAKLYMEKK